MLYQSNKYQKATAKSQVIEVELVKANNFDIVQNSTKKMTLTFSSAVKSLAVADVTVNKMIGEYAYPQTVKSAKLADDGMSATIEVFNNFVNNFNYVVKVKNFEDNSFIASVGTPVRMEVVADGKNPSWLITTGVAATIKCLFYDEKEVDVTDTINTNLITLGLEKAATDGSYYLAGKQLTIKKSSVSAVVTAKYLGKFENGKYTGALEDKTEFFAEDAAAVVPVSVKDYDLGTDWNSVTHSLQLKEQKVLRIRLNQNDNQGGTNVYTNGTLFGSNGNKITFTAVTPDIADISSGSVVTGHKAGVAQFYVNYAVKQANGTFVENPFAVIEITVLDNAIVNSVALTKTDVLCGTSVVNNVFDREFIYLIASDQRGGRINFPAVDNSDQNEKDENDNFYTITVDGDTVKVGPDGLVEGAYPADKFTLKCLSSGYGKADVNELAKQNEYIGLWGQRYYSDGKNKNSIMLTVNGDKLRDYLVDSEALKTKADDGEVIVLHYEISYKTDQNVTLTSTFTVTLQEPGSATYDYIQVNPSTTWIDLTRINDGGYMKKEEKTISFEVYKMNNGVIIDTVEVDKYDSKAATEGSYQYKILKNGNEINTVGSTEGKLSSWWLDAANLDNNVITIHPTSTADVTGLAAQALAGAAVVPNYNNGGAGVYTFALYKWNTVNGQFIPVQQLAVDVTAVVNSAGSYTLDVNAQRQNAVTVADTNGVTYNKDDAEKILKCFTIKDTKSNDVVGYDYTLGKDVVKTTNNYYVNYSAPAGAKYVYVKEIVFYENIGGNVYIPFTVPVDVSLQR